MTYDVLTPGVARLWPYSPDWRSGFNVRRSFRTDIVGSRDNTEQRRSTRSSPRFSVDYRTVVQDDLRAANHWLRAWQNKPTIIPDFSRWARLTGASSIGTDTLTISPMPVWAAAGQRLVLCGAATEEVLVESVAGDVITLADNLVNAWGIGSVLRPTFFGLFDGRLSSSRLNKGAAQISVSLDAYPGGEPPQSAGTAWATFNGREVFTLQPDYSGAPSVSYAFPAEQVDFERGRTAQFRPIERAEREVEADFNGLTLAEATQAEQFFDRMKGRRGAFYISTGEKDFILNATAGSGSSSFTAAGPPDIAADFGDVDYAAVETAIAICMVDGSHIYRRITDIAPSGGNSIITVNAAWGVELSLSSVARISWMPIWRFASDEMVTSWRTPLNANIRFAFQSVKS